MALRRRTRETRRHERAVVLQALGTPTAEQIRADLEANRLRADRLRRQARRGSCERCNDQAGGCWHCGRG